MKGRRYPCTKMVVFSALVWCGVVAVSQTGESCPGDTMPDMCPTNCTCCFTKPQNTEYRMMVNCGLRESFYLKHELNNIFIKRPNITSLRVTGTRLNDLKEIKLCYLTRLNTLLISSNWLTTLDGGEFRCLESLQTLNASSNRITTLGRDTLTGLPKLMVLILNQNEINDIHPSALTDLKSIRAIYINDNNLTSIDVWPLYLVVNSRKSVNISLTRNNIINVTNDLKWSYTCQMPPAHGRIDVQQNNIKHLNIFKSWGIGSLLNAFCLFGVTNNFHVELATNPLICNCFDFEVYKMMRAVPFSLTIDKQRCAAPSEFYNVQIIKIPLSKFVCYAKENCPPGCDCIEQPANVTYHINCKNLHLQTMPPSVPETLIGEYHYHFKYKFLFRNNNLRSISNHSYLRLGYYADFSLNLISEVSSGTLGDLLQHLEVLHLDNNMLSVLPTEVQGMTFPNLKLLSLHGNPWSCECKDRWFKSWLTNMSNVISAKDAMLCETPARLKSRNILHIPDEEFCTDPKQTLTIRLVLICVGTIGGVVLIVVVSGSVAYRLRVWIYTRFRLHPFNSDECVGENKRYDVFVSYANEDEAWALELMHYLENKGYKVFFHKRDFLAGMSVTGNVGLAVESSKRTLCNVTPAFAASATCMWEFTTALNVDLEENKHRLVVILKEDVPLEQQESSLRDYLRGFTYIDFRNRDFMWSQLLYSLPVKKMGDPVEDQEGGGGGDAEGEQQRFPRRIHHVEAELQQLVGNDDVPLQTD